MCAHAFAQVRIRKTQGIDPLALVFFTEVQAVGDSDSLDQDSVMDADTLLTPVLIKTMRRSTSGLNGAAPSRCLDFSHYMDKTPLSIPPRLPAELVIDLFVKMGPRYVIVKENGRIVGIVTKKDIIRYTSLHRQ
jgi:CBS domain-containing protein